MKMIWNISIGKTRRLQIILNITLRPHKTITNVQQNTVEFELLLSYMHQCCNTFTSLYATLSKFFKYSTSCQTSSKV